MGRSPGQHRWARSQTVEWSIWPWLDGPNGPWLDWGTDLVAETPSGATLTATLSQGQALALSFPLASPSSLGEGSADFDLSPSKLSCTYLALVIKGVVESFRLSSSRNYKWRWNKNSMWYNLCWVLAVGQRWRVSRIVRHSLNEHQKNDCVEDQWELPHLQYMRISLLSVDKDA